MFSVGEVDVAPHFEAVCWIRIDYFGRVMPEKDFREKSLHSFCYIVKRRRKKRSVSSYQGNHINCKEADGAPGEQAVI